jgi:hypothetical protein
MQQQNSLLLLLGNNSQAALARATANQATSNKSSANMLSLKEGATTTAASVTHRPDGIPHRHRSNSLFNDLETPSVESKSTREFLCSATICK